MSAQANAASSTPRYLQIAESIESSIRTGKLRTGERLLSIRALSQQKQVSISTAMQAYMWLQDRGLLEVRPRSGFYVRKPGGVVSPGLQPCSKTIPTTAGLSVPVGTIVRDVADPSNVPMAFETPDPEFLPTNQLNVILRRILLDQPGHSTSYQCPIGSQALRHQIARRALSYGCDFSEDDVIVTVGSTEALSLSLRAVTKPGDPVAVESPSSFSVLQAVESLGLDVVEISADPETGLDLDFLDRTAKKTHLGACVASTNCQNPLGYILSDERKRRLADIITRHGVPLIENDVYGDLAFGPCRPKPAKAFDSDGLVLLISSFSRLLAPGFRVGWVSPGRFGERVGQLKFTNTLATPSLLQSVIARFLESGGYDRHVRRLRQRFAEQTERAREKVLDCFPDGTQVTAPLGSFLLWVKLPGEVQAIDLYRKALQNRIGILPGDIFSATRRFHRHIRISCAQKWSDRFEQAVAMLGALCFEMV